MSGLVLDGPEPRVDLDDVLVVAAVRNERLRLPDFMHHHRRLGVTQFLIADNNSSDGTADLLAAQPDVTLFRTDESYAAANCGIDWTNEILNRYANGRWTLVLDADELFVFPFCEDLDLRDLITYLDGHGSDAVLAPMIDMYAHGQIVKTGYRAGTSLLENCPFFDGHGYQFSDAKQSGPPAPLRGGPRHRLFWSGQDREFRSPSLRKIPFIKWRDDFALEASTHILRGATLSAVSGAILHFKFLQDFAESSIIEASRKEHFGEARQYGAYAEVFTKEPDLTAFYSGSALYVDSLQLVALGLMSLPPDFAPERQ